jgi:hypothetical protein
LTVSSTKGIGKRFYATHAPTAATPLTAGFIVANQSREALNAALHFPGIRWNENRKTGR